MSNAGLHLESISGLGRPAVIYIIVNKCICMYGAIHFTLITSVNIIVIDNPKHRPICIHIHY